MDFELIELRVVMNCPDCGLVTATIPSKDVIQNVTMSLWDNYQNVEFLVKCPSCGRVGYVGVENDNG